MTLQSRQWVDGAASSSLGLWNCNLYIGLIRLQSWHSALLRLGSGWWLRLMTLIDSGWWWLCRLDNGLMELQLCHWNGGTAVLTLVSYGCNLDTQVRLMPLQPSHWVDGAATFVTGLVELQPWRWTHRAVILTLGSGWWLCSLHNQVTGQVTGQALSCHFGCHFLSLLVHIGKRKKNSAI